MERRRHWWNGRFANRARRDIYFWTDSDGWHVEVSRGSLSRHRRHFAFEDEAAALAMIEALLAGNGDTWREVGT